MVDHIIYQESSLPHVLTGEVGQGSFSMTTRSKTKKRLTEEETSRKSPPISPLNQRSWKGQPRKGQPSRFLWKTKLSLCGLFVGRAGARTLIWGLKWQPYGQLHQMDRRNWSTIITHWECPLIRWFWSAYQCAIFRYAPSGMDPTFGNVDQVHVARKDMIKTIHIMGPIIGGICHIGQLILTIYHF